jgi:hypothetical protein
MSHAFVVLNDFVESIGHPTGSAGPFQRQADSQFSFIQIMKRL